MKSEGASQLRKRRKVRKSKRTASKATEKSSTREDGRSRLPLLGSASLEPKISFSLFGNKYDLDEFSEEASEPHQKEHKTENQK